MESDLISELHVALLRFPELRLLSGHDTETLRASVARQFELSTGGPWWWEELRVPVRTLEYGQDDGLTVLQSVLPASTKDCYLFLTDDDAPPWSCIRGPGDALIQLLRDLRFVECFFRRRVL
jgi:hypothetical protein